MCQQGVISTANFWELALSTKKLKADQNWKSCYFGGPFPLEHFSHISAMLVLQNLNQDQDKQYSSADKPSANQINVFKIEGCGNIKAASNGGCG